MDLVQFKKQQKEHIEVYNSWGLKITPVNFKHKNPVLPGWQNKDLSEEEIKTHFFNGKLYNIGIRLGETAGGVIDIDLDCKEACQIASSFLPATARFGREGKKGSHYIYYSSAETKKYEWKGETLLELRASGQTVFPGSVHESGEEILWENTSSPMFIPSEIITKKAGMIASIIILSKYWIEGTRQKVSLCISKILLENNYTVEEVTQFITAACHLAGDTDIQQRTGCVKSTQKKIQQNDKAAGIPTLEELTCKELVEKLKDWLQIKPKEYESAVFKLNKKTDAIEQEQKKLSIYDYILKPGELNLREDWLIDEVLAPETITTYFSRSGGGKSFIALLKSLYLLVNNKVDTVLYLDNDNSKRALKSRRIEEICQLYKNFLYVPSYKVDKHLMPVLIQSLVSEKLGHCLIIIDSIRNFLEGDPNSDKDSIHFMDIVKDLRSKGNTIILLHHVNKQKEIKNNTSIVDYSDIVYEMDSENNKDENNIFLNFKIYKDRIGARENFTGVIDYKKLSLKLEVNAVNPEDSLFVDAVTESLTGENKKQTDIIKDIKSLSIRTETAVNLLKKYTGAIWKYAKGEKNANIYTLIENAAPKKLLYYELPILLYSKFNIGGKLENSIKSSTSEGKTREKLENSIKTPFLEGEEVKTANPLSFPVFPADNSEESIENIEFSSFPGILRKDWEKQNEDEITDVPF